MVITVRVRGANMEKHRGKPFRIDNPDYLKILRSLIDGKKSLAEIHSKVTKKGYQNTTHKKIQWLEKQGFVKREGKKQYILFWDGILDYMLKAVHEEKKPDGPIDVFKFLKTDYHMTDDDIESALRDEKKRNDIIKKLKGEMSPERFAYMKKKSKASLRLLEDNPAVIVSSIPIFTEEIRQSDSLKASFLAFVKKIPENHETATIRSAVRSFIDAVAVDAMNRVFYQAQHKKKLPDAKDAGFRWFRMRCYQAVNLQKMQDNPLYSEASSCL